MAASDRVELTDLDVFSRYSLAVRHATADRDELVATLRADLAWLEDTGRRPGAGRAVVEHEHAATAPAVPVTPAKRAPARKAVAKKTAARKTAAQKTVAQKTVARKTVARKTAARKTTTRAAARGRR